jgi:hypothetical protein
MAGPIRTFLMRGITVAGVGGLAALALATTGSVASGRGANAARPTAGWGTILGTIHDESGNPLANGCATAQRADGQGSWNPGPTGPSGSYGISVPPGMYLVEFYDCSSSRSRVPEIYDGHSGLDSDRARPVTVADGGTTSGVDGTLVPGGSITAHAQDVNGAPLQNVYVCPHFGSDSAQDAWCVSTDAAGNATLTGVLPGKNRLSASFYRGGFSQFMYYNQRPGVFWAGDKVRSWRARRPVLNRSCSG